MLPFNDEPREDFAFWTTLWRYVRPQRKKLYFTAFLSLVVGVMVAIQPLVIKFIVDEGILRPDASNREKMLYSLGFVGVYYGVSAGRVTLWTLGYRVLVNTMEQFLFSIRSQFFRHLQVLCFRFHDTVSSGELFNYIMGSPINTLKQFLQQFVLAVPFQVVAWVVALGVLSSFDLLMTGIFTLTVVVVVLLNRRSRRIIRTISADFLEHESDASKYVADMLRGTREIKIHAIGERVSGRFDDKIGIIRDKEEYLLRKQQIERIKPEAINYVGVGIIFMTGAYSCVYRDLTVGELMAFAGAMGALMGPLMQLFNLNLIRANAEAGLERITRILATESTVPEAAPERQITVAEAEQQARDTAAPLIEFDQVSFAYHLGWDGEHPHYVLDNISCAIRDGESIGLVGPSGSGKSTFIRLILRFYDPQHGAIRLNGHNLRCFEQDDLRANFGVVSQNPFVFQTTIFENVRVANNQASNDMIYQAMQIAGVTDFLDDLPAREHTEVGEDGYGLSGGQKQRVAIARAIVSNPRYFIFDEATSALDNQSEHKIQAAMEQLMQKHTMFIIAHRLSTIRNVDRIFVFDHGRIVQTGDYPTLTQTPGLFQDLVSHGL